MEIDINEVTLNSAYLGKTVNINFSYWLNNLCTIRIYMINKT